MKPKVIKPKLITFATMMHLEESGEWFESWFDSPYYHVLYDHRNDDEARAFIAALIEHIGLKPGASVLDLCCGAGRHSRVIHELGYNTTGCDLSANSIATAKQFEQDGLGFFRHDMRDPLPESYDAIFNLFTSFGYFENEEDINCAPSGIATLLFFIYSFIAILYASYTLSDKSFSLSYISPYSLASESSCFC